MGSEMCIRDSFFPSPIKPQGLAFDENEFLYLALGRRNQIRVYDLQEAREIRKIKLNHFAGELNYHQGYLYVGGGEHLSRFKVL